MPRMVSVWFSGSDHSFKATGACDMCVSGVKQVIDATEMSECYDVIVRPSE